MGTTETVFLPHINLKASFLRGHEVRAISTYSKTRKLHTHVATAVYLQHTKHKVQHN